MSEDILEFQDRHDSIEFARHKTGISISMYQGDACWESLTREQAEQLRDYLTTMLEESQDLYVVDPGITPYSVLQMRQTQRTLVVLRVEEDRVLVVPWSGGKPPTDVEEGDGHFWIKNVVKPGDSLLRQMFQSEEQWQDFLARQKAAPIVTTGVTSPEMWEVWK